MIDKRLTYGVISTGFSVKGLMWAVPMITFVNKVAAAMAASLLIMMLLIGFLYFLAYAVEKMKYSYEYLYEYVQYVRNINSQPIRTSLRVRRI